MSSSASGSGSGSGSSRRVYALRKFGAHGRQVTALQVGRRSGRVLVTGGDDRLVNMWAIGKPSAIMSLAGMDSGISSVSFDAEEQQVVAGSDSGAIKVWDLDTQEAFRDFPGAHSGSSGSGKSSVSVLEYHPFGGHVASGGSDATMKLWDVRAKNCIQTYRGHQGGAVTSIRFSPDGRWAVSGGEDAQLKLWDLTAGKELHTFSLEGSSLAAAGDAGQAHRGAVTDVQFHPTEFLLASADAAGVTRCWDLENFRAVADMSSSRRHGLSGVKRIQFDPEGLALLTTDAENLRVWQWEPDSRCLDIVGVKWGNVMDTNITADQFVACSTQESFVTIWVMSLSKLRPWAHPEGEVFDPLEHSQVDLDEQRETAERLRRTSEEFSSRASGSGESAAAAAVAAAAQVKKEEQRQQQREERPAVKRPEPQRAAPSAERGRGSSGGGSSLSPPSEEVERSTSPLANPADVLSESIGRVDVAAGASTSDVAEALLREHSTMVGLLNSRLTKLKLVRRAWTEGDVRDAVEVLVKEINDPAVAVDVVSVLQKKSSLLTLDVCVLLLPVLRDLLEAETSNYVLIALKMATSLAQSFSSVIADTLAQGRKLQGQRQSGLDLSFEERLEKAEYCHKEFGGMSASIEKVGARHRTSAQVGKQARELRTALYWLEQSS